MKIQLAFKSGPVEVEAQGRGEWAIHRIPGDDEHWAVTHVPTGLAAGDIPLTRAQAGDFAARLSAEFPTLRIPAGIWARQPSVDDMGPGYQKIVDRMRALRAEVLGQ